MSHRLFAAVRRRTRTCTTNPLVTITRSLTDANRSGEGGSKNQATLKPPSLLAVGAVVCVVATGSAPVLFYSKQEHDEHLLQQRQQTYQLSEKRRHRLAAYLVSPRVRHLLTDHVNRLVNVPGLGERVEGILIRQAVDQCMNAMEHLLLVGIDTDDEIREDKEEGETFFLQELLTTDDDDDDDNQRLALQEWLVDKINAQVDLYGLNETQEAVLIRGLVAKLFQLFPGIVGVLPNYQLVL